jgi:soluble lytic murein transglycosylase-like protein
MSARVPPRSGIDPLRAEILFSFKTSPLLRDCRECMPSHAAPLRAASGGYMCSNESSVRGNATVPIPATPARTSSAARAGQSFVVFMAALLLSACAGQLPMMPGSAESIGGQQSVAAPAVAESARTRRVRAKDVLAEWGTFGIEPRSFRKGSAAQGPRAMLTMPDYSESIQEIVANASCHSCDGKPFHRMVVNASLRHGVPPSLIHAVIQKESGYNPHARSRRNARGLMQVTPATARFVGVRHGQSLYDPQTNIHAGTAYLKYLMSTHVTFDEVLAAYNSGPGNVRKYNGVPPFNETRRYVRDVRKFYAVTSGDEPRPD